MARKGKTRESLNPDHKGLTACCEAIIVKKNGKSVCSFCGKSLCRSTFPENLPKR